MYEPPQRIDPSFSLPVEKLTSEKCKRKKSGSVYRKLKKSRKQN